MHGLSSVDLILRVSLPWVCPQQVWSRRKPAAAVSPSTSVFLTLPSWPERSRAGGGSPSTRSVVHSVCLGSSRSHGCVCFFVSMFPHCLLCLPGSLAAGRAFRAAGGSFPWVGLDVATRSLVYMVPLQGMERGSPGWGPLQVSSGKL